MIRRPRSGEGPTHTQNWNGGLTGLPLGVCVCVCLGVGGVLWTSGRPLGPPFQFWVWVGSSPDLGLRITAPHPSVQNRQKCEPARLACCRTSSAQYFWASLNDVPAAKLPPPSNWCGTPPTPKHPDTPRTACEAETPTSGGVCGVGWGGRLASRCSGAGRRRRTDSKKKRPKARNPPKPPASPPALLPELPELTTKRAPPPNFSKSGSSRPFKPVQTDFLLTLLAPPRAPTPGTRPAWGTTNAGS